MAEALFIFDKTGTGEYISKLNGILNPAGTFNEFVRRGDEEEIAYVTASLANSPLKGERYYESEDHILLFAGDLIEQKKLEFQRIIDSFAEEDLSYIKSLNGIFAIFLFDKKKKKFYAISDKRAQTPVFYFADKKRLIVSTNLIPFISLLEKPQFNPDWMYNYFFFNFYSGEESFIKNVSKLSAGKTLEIDTGEMTVVSSQKLEPYGRNGSFYYGKEALEAGKNLFGERIPLYYSSESENACPITAGWDARTTLALAPNYDSVVSYTYGMNDCFDIRRAKEAVKSAGIKHISIIFDDSFVKSLPERIEKTARESSGMQGPLRSSLHFVYKKLTENGKRYPVTLSGINYDALFRGHFANAILPEEAKELHRGNFKDFKNSKLKSVFTDERKFELSMENLRDYLNRNYKLLSDKESRLRFHAYEYSTNYYMGEIKLANNYTSYRAPCLDDKITSLAFNMEYSSLKFDDIALNPEIQKDEFILQAYALTKLAPRFAKEPVRDVVPRDYANNSIKFALNKRLIHAKEAINKKINVKSKQSRLEDWSYWLIEKNRDYVNDTIFGENAKIKDYFKESFIAKNKKEPNIREIGNMIYFETLLKMITDKK